MFIKFFLSRWIGLDAYTTMAEGQVDVVGIMQKPRWCSPWDDAL